MTPNTSDEGEGLKMLRIFVDQALSSIRLLANSSSGWIRNR
jgi:hypothetical protein